MIPPPEQAARLSVWPPARRGLAAAALGCAVVTSATGALVGDGPWTTLAALAQVVAALWALVDSRMLAAQVAAGVGLAWGLVPGTGGPVVAVVAVVVGVVATSELLGASGRLGMVIERDPAPEVRRVGVAVAIALATSGAALAAGSLAGPSGLVATAVAALGCILVAAAVGAQR
jgi:hypothetical protein